jgi:hypothetical protein
VSELDSIRSILLTKGIPRVFIKEYEISTLCTPNAKKSAAPTSPFDE